MIREILPCGKEHAIPGNELVKILGLKDLRMLTQIIELEREIVPICASMDSGRPGCYLPASPAELESYIKSFDRRMGNMARTRKNLDDALQKMVGQEQIGGW